MTPNRFLERLQSGSVLVLDGATGTNLQQRGLPAGSPSDIWVMDRPEAVMALHRDFLQAGSDILLTNTFGSSRVNLHRSGWADRFEETNRKAVALLRQVIEGTETLAAGSLGPLGEMLQPYGLLGEQEAETAYADQARILSEEGVDLLVIETQFDLNEAKAAIRGVRSVSDLPLICSFSYDRGTRTMMGVKPAQVGSELADAGLSALGINCGRSLEDNAKVLQELRQVTDLPIWFKPNAGLPKTDGSGRNVYDVTPEMMGAQVVQWIEGGARFVGGCCGTSPEHLRSIAHAAHALAG